MTQIMARGTSMLDSRHKVPMTGRVYLRAIVPIGVFFSLSLICGNVTYLYLSVSFIQMLKVRIRLGNIVNSEQKLTTHLSGHHAGRCAACQLVARRLAAQP